MKAIRAKEIINLAWIGSPVSVTSGEAAHSLTTSHARSDPWKSLSGDVQLSLRGLRRRAGPVPIHEELLNMKNGLP
jgi:hypothetical protein